MRINSHQVTKSPSHQIKFFILFTFTFLLFTLSGCVKREITNIGSKGTNIICFGDSLTVGYGVNPGQDFPSVLDTMTDIPIINAGLDGDTSVSALQRIDSDVLDRDPLLVILEFGGNDFLRKIPLEDTAKSIEMMIQKIQDKGAMVAIADIHIGLIMSGYEKEFKNLAKKYNAILIPSLLSGIITNPELKSDFLHPNSEGYKIIAQRIYRTMLPYLNRNIIIKKFGK